MAHKTLIDGTSYEISGGKTLVEGTAYSITEGRSLVDGTGYTIGFAAQEYTITVSNGYSNTLSEGLRAVLILPDGTVAKSGSYTVREGETVVVETRCGKKKVLGSDFAVSYRVTPEGGATTWYDCSEWYWTVQSDNVTVTGNMEIYFSYEEQEE